VNLEIKSVEKLYKIVSTQSVIHALNGVELTLPAGKTLGIVGESGCGKSTLARLVTGLETPNNGSITWDGLPIHNVNKGSFSTKKSVVQLVFQDPYSSLNPRQRIGDAISEIISVHKLVEKRLIDSRVSELLALVGLADDLKSRYPHQLSGGQRQRVSIARALAAEPNLLVLDEPVSALDVSVRAEVMNLLIDLREKLGLTYIFISHDLAMIRYISDYVAVMYLGKIVEFGIWEQVINDPMHPYTQALIRAMPDHTVIGNPESLAKTLQGEVPDPVNLPTGCAFHLRCVKATPACASAPQKLIEISPNHQVACMEAKI
jgi:oligopeptide/dipeptide ABC transporter ATP-binding protein